MKKEEAINYLNKIRPFINLSAICNDYNYNNPENPIDYNNLRVVLNRKAVTRLSEDKLNSFILYLFKILYTKTFEIKSVGKEIDENEIKKVLKTRLKSAVRDILEEIENEF